MFGTNSMGGAGTGCEVPDRALAYELAVVDYCLAGGIIPVLSAIPPVPDKDLTCGAPGCSPCWSGRLRKPGNSYFRIATGRLCPCPASGFSKTVCIQICMSITGPPISNRKHCTTD